MKRVLVDTNVIIDYLRRKDKANSLFFQVFSLKDYIAVVSLTTITELWAGRSMTKQSTLKKVKKIIDNCEITLPSLEIAKQTGRILRQTNYQISFQDAQIAALTLENKFPLLTLDQKDFRKIKRIKFFRLND